MTFSRQELHGSRGGQLVSRTFPFVLSYIHVAFPSILLP